MTEKVERFLRAVDKTFPVPLSERQDLTDFAKKLIEKATICTKTADGEIVSLVAGYTENTTENMGYISVVATKEEYRGQGLAKELLREFIDVAEAKGLSAVHLYAVPENTAAINMYENLGFEPYIVKGEPRPDDAHLIYYIGDKL